MMKDIISPTPTDAVALSAHTTLRWVLNTYNIEYLIYNTILKLFIIHLFLLIYLNVSIYDKYYVSCNKDYFQTIHVYFFKILLGY